MKKIVSTFICVMSVALPSLANIGVDNTEPTCDESTIGATSGSTELEAQWSANTINLKWYNGDNELNVQNDAKTCSYDGAITLPETEPTRAGYTFAGWKAKICSMESLNYNIQASTARFKPLSNNSEYTMKKEYGYENNNDLNNGEWVVPFNYGTVKGFSVCNDTPGTSTWNYITSPSTYNYDNDAIMANMLDTVTPGKYCWCIVKEVNNVSCNSSFVLAAFYKNHDENSICTDQCTWFCATAVQRVPTFRKVLFGQSN